MIDYQRINNTMGKMSYYLSNHNNILVSVSGGSDSDIIVHIIATYFREHLYKIHFVFSDTGLEYKATLNHLNDLENKYGIKIERIKGTPIPIAVKKYGVPFVSKLTSELLSRLQRHNFQYEDSDFEELYKKYPKSKSALEWWSNDKGEGSMFNISRNSHLKDYLMCNHPDFKVSAKCCDVSKKAPAIKYIKQNNIDLDITGERKAEGGIRSAHKSCFGSWHGIDKYMPLFFWNDEVKAYYKEHENIRYSDCYEIYGMKRTGCCGCAFALNRKEELEIMQRFEPNLYKACNYVFGKSYDFTDNFIKYKDDLKQKQSLKSNKDK